MTRKEFKTVFERIIDSYPNKFGRYDEKLRQCVVSPEMARTWYDNLSDLDAKAVWFGLGDYVKENKFPPSIAELRFFAERYIEEYNPADWMNKVWGMYPGDKNYQVDLYHYRAVATGSTSASDLNRFIRNEVRKAEQTGELLPFAELVKNFELEVAYG